MQERVHIKLTKISLAILEKWVSIFKKKQLFLLGVLVKAGEEQEQDGRLSGKMVYRKPG